MAYNRTNWSDKVTQLNAKNLNNIEDGICENIRRCEILSNRLDNIKESFNNSEIIDEKLETIKEEFSSIVSDFDKLKISLESWESDIDLIKKDIDSYNEKLNQSKKDLIKTQEDLTKNNEDLEKLQGDLNSAKIQLESSNTNINVLNQNLSIANQQLDETKKQLNLVELDLIEANKKLEENDKIKLEEERIFNLHRKYNKANWDKLKEASDEIQSALKEGKITSEMLNDYESLIDYIYNNIGLNIHFNKLEKIENYTFLLSLEGFLINSDQENNWISMTFIFSKLEKELTYNEIEDCLKDIYLKLPESLKSKIIPVNRNGQFKKLWIPNEEEVNGKFLFSNDKYYENFCNYKDLSKEDKIKCNRIATGNDYWLEDSIENGHKFVDENGNIERDEDSNKHSIRICLSI